MLKLASGLSVSPRFSVSELGLGLRVGFRVSGVGFRR